MSFANGGLVVDGSITGPLTVSNLQVSSISSDIAYSLSSLRRIIDEEIEKARQDEDSGYSDDDYEAGHAEGYTAGFLDGLTHVLDTLEKKS